MDHVRHPRYWWWKTWKSVLVGLLVPATEAGKAYWIFCPEIVEEVQDWRLCTERVSTTLMNSQFWGQLGFHIKMDLCVDRHFLVHPFLKCSGKIIQRLHWKFFWAIIDVLKKIQTFCFSENITKVFNIQSEQKLSQTNWFAEIWLDCFIIGRKLAFRIFFFWKKRKNCWIELTTIQMSQNLIQVFGNL